MEDDIVLNRINDMLKGIGFRLLKEHEIIFNPPSSKIDYLKNDLIYFGYNDTKFIIHKKFNKIEFRSPFVGNGEKEWFIGEYFLPHILQYLKEIYPKEVRLYKIKKILNK